MEHAAIYKIYLALKFVIPAAIGALFAIVTGDKMKFWMSVFMFLTGTYIATVFGWAMIDWMEVTKKTIQTAILLGWGLFGMAVILQLRLQIPDFIRAAKEKWLSK